MSVRKKSVFAEKLPREAEVENAKQLQDIIEAQVLGGGPVCLSSTNDDGRTETVTLRPSITKALLEVLWLVSDGRGADVIPLETHLTANRVAVLLNKTRPQVMKMLEAGEMPYTMVGRYPRIPTDAFFAYRRRRELEPQREMEEPQREMEEPLLLAQMMHRPEDEEDECDE